MEVARALHDKHKVAAEKIAILTPYTAQKFIIQEALKDAKLDKIQVTTITETQGK